MGQNDRMTDVLAVVAATWGILMGLSPLLQVRRIIRRRSSADISIAYLTVLVIGFALWATYGISIQNPAVAVSNSVSLTVGVLTIAVARRYAGGPSASRG